MIADVKKAFAMLPDLYQAKQQLLMIFVLTLLALVTLRRNGNGLDLSMQILFMAIYGSTFYGLLLRMDYADLMAASALRRRIAFRVVPLVYFISLVLCWCLVILFSYGTGLQTDLSGANAVVLMGLYCFFSVYGMSLTVLSAKFNRILSLVFLAVTTFVMIFCFTLFVSGGESLTVWLAMERFADMFSFVTPGITIAIVAVLSVPMTLLLLLLLRLTWKRPVRREYLSRLKG